MLKAPPLEQPKISCRCCGETLRADWQRGLLPYHAPYWLLTCDNAGCDLFGYTLGEGEYLAIDLTEYLASGRKRREERR